MSLGDFPKAVARVSEGFCPIRVEVDGRAMLRSVPELDKEGQRFVYDRREKR